MAKSLTRSQAKARADIAFSRYIKARDMNGGTCFCKCCGCYVGANFGSVGHVMKRRHDSLRYDERNAYFIHEFCNNQDFEFCYLDKAVIEELEAEKHTLAKFTTQDFLQIEDKFKQKLKEL
jgi:hypothetical protein